MIYYMQGKSTKIMHKSKLKQRNTSFLGVIKLKLDLPYNEQLKW